MTTAVAAGALATPAEILRLIDGAGVLAVDLETTGLDPRTCKVRLLSISDGNQTLVIDAFEHDLRPIVPALCGKILIAHNAAFDLAFLWHLGLTDLPETICTYLTSKLLSAGLDGHGFGPEGHNGLAACVKRYLGLDLPKDLQTSDWSGPLSTDQVEYARRDAEVLIPLVRALDVELDRTRLHRAADVEMRALRAFVWMAQSGVAFDREAWLALAGQAAARKKQLAGQLDAAAPRKGEAGLFGAVEHWNWDSPKQVKEVLALGGVHVETTADAQLALIKGALPALLRLHRHEAQLVKMYGANWLDKARIDGDRVYPGWRQLGAASGRTSCEGPNMQQIPRDEVDGRVIYRTCMKAPPGRVLVKADYATLQMRIACKYARDDALLAVFRADADVHTATARALLGKDNPTKAERQIAKSANFALLFGAGAEGLRIYCKMTFGIDLTEGQAKAHRAAFFRTYPGLERWHNEARNRKVKETRSASGRRRLLPPHAPTTWLLNTPVQASESDGAKTAMALLWERRGQCPGAFPVIFNHDEIVLEVSTDQSEQARVWLEEAMMEGMTPFLDPVPCKVDSKIVSTWGG